MKRTPIRRTRGGKTTTAPACRDYRQSTDGECEVTQYLDGDAKRWMSGHKITNLEVHHIAGRGRLPEYDWFTNLLLVSSAAHGWCHDRCPPHFELACWFAKTRKHILYKAEVNCGIAVERPIERLEFHLPSLNRIVTPMVSFAGRIEYLREKVRGTTFEAYADEILAFVEGE